MSAISRAPARKHLASLLNAALVGDGLPVDEVFSYLAGKFGDRARKIVVVSDGPVERKIKSLGNCYDTFITLNVYILVLYSDRQNGWTESDAEDAIDEIETAIADTIINNQSAEGYWNFASYSAPTEIETPLIGGKAYRAELIRILMEKTQ